MKADDIHPLFADWYAHADRAPSGDQLARRFEGVQAFLTEASLTQLAESLRHFPDSSSEGRSIGVLQNHLKKADSTFLMRGNEPELDVLLKASLLLTIDSGGPKATGVALAVDVTSMLGARAIGPLTRELVTAAQLHLQEEGQRRRVEPDLTAASPSRDGRRRSKTSPPAPGELELPHPGADVPQVQANVLALAKHVAELTASLTETTGVLRSVLKNQGSLAASAQFIAVLAEESDMLWWLLAGHSRFPERPLSTYRKEAVALVVGKDLADLTRLAPGPLPIPALIRKTLDDNGVDSGDTLTLAQVVPAVDMDWAEAAVQGGVGALRGIACCLPSLASLVELRDTDAWHRRNAKDDKAVLDVSLAAPDWARLLYTECLLLRELRIPE